MTYTTEQKYAYICSKLRVTDVDLWEQDALLSLGSTYFQFGGGDVYPPDADTAIVRLMREEHLCSH